METISVLIVDDHQIIVDGLKALLQDREGIRIAGEASNGRDALKLLSLIQVDVVLLDLDMPVMNGIETTKEIKSNFPDIRVIILTMHLEQGLVKTLMNAGADGYLVKNSDQDGLLSAIRNVMSGQQVFSPDVTLSLLNKDQKKRISTSPGFKLSSLTSREIEVLKLIAQGYSNKEIGESLYISHRTVDTHRTNLMKKLEVKNIAGLIRIAIQNGLVN